MAALFGRRMRRGAASTAVAAAAMAALSASGAPSAVSEQPAAAAADRPSAGAPGQEDPSITGDSPYYTELPDLKGPGRNDPPHETPTTGSAESGIPATVLDAYRKAEASLAASNPRCRVPWELLAAIGKVESGHARGGRLDADGTTPSPILGPVLNGVGFANISDTDGGAYDGDTLHDRAVGPMQFIPQTWESWGRDGNGDGRRDPNNIYDAALAAGSYLCAHDRDLTVERDLHQAILGYNRSQEYLRTVLRWYDHYRKDAHEVPDGSQPAPGAPAGTGGTTPSPDPVRPGRPGTPSPSPTEPGKPDKPNKPGDGGSSKPTPPPTTPPPTTPPPTTPPPTTPAPATRLVDLGDGEFTAPAGERFADRPAVRAERADKKPAAQAKVRFTVTGGTGTTFEGGATTVTVTTKADGVAKAPALLAGGKPGALTVKATLLGTTKPVTLGLRAEVTAPRADKLVPTDETELTCEAGATFEGRIALTATRDGEAAPGVAATATVLAGADPADGEKAADEGPYFLTPGDEPAEDRRTRELPLTTDAKGNLLLPELHTDDTTGTFRLRVETTGGAVVVLELKVTEAA
ncbi:lytic transglycosylase domain-containing protein [Streptomyces sp. WAC00276]|uniref:lytic transglycosylase domain-containing protein n=1 Tax=Streptomyces sp. WAC00276 TaxID=2933778 RepID=UPI001FFF43E1|nr:lytic transglycosylase domain-containing protein [Streptomyces sp. WAC00276]MCK2144115.1 lytic transglycosylase domain-containing protein [Streptomyces sp. WAC00276]